MPRTITTVTSQYRELQTKISGLLRISLCCCCLTAFIFCVWLRNVHKMSVQSFSCCCCCLPDVFFLIYFLHMLVFISFLYLFTTVSSSPSCSSPQLNFASVISFRRNASAENFSNLNVFFTFWRNADADFLLRSSSSSERTAAAAAVGVNNNPFHQMAANSLTKS